MRGISSSSKNRIHELVDELFDRMTLHLIGEVPSLKNKKSIIFTSKPNLTLAHLFIKSLGSERPMPQEQEALKNLLSTAEEYISSLRSKTKAQVTESIDSYVKEQALKNERASTVEIKNRINEALTKARNHFKTIAEAESTKARNMGKALQIGKVAASQGVKDPNVYYVVIRDGKTCNECVRLHLMDDLVTPRVWKLSEIGFGYHKRGQPNPKIAGLHPHCFVGNRNVKVLTEHAGYINIKDVKIGDRVLTHKGQFKTVLNTLEYWDKKYYGDFYSIVYRYKNRDGYKNFKIKVTPEHEFLTPDGWVKARDLSLPKHKFIQLKTTCGNCGKHTEIKPQKSDKSKMEGYFCSRKCVTSFQWKNLSHAKNISEKSKSQKIEFVKNNPEKIREKIKKAQNKTRKLISNRLFWAQKEENLDTLRKNISKTNPKKQKERTSEEEFLLKSFLEETKIPFNHQEIVEKWTVDFLLPDHKVIIEYDGGDHYLPVYTGKITMDSFMKKQKGRDSYLNKCGYHVLRYGYIPSREEFLNDIYRLSNNSNSKYIFESLEIMSIKKVTNKKRGYRLYDLTVEDDESFIVNGIVSHNCRCSLAFLAPGFGFKSGQVSWMGEDHDEYQAQRGQQ